MPHSATTDFAPLDLSVDDLLPADIELVMGYRRRPGDDAWPLKKFLAQ